MFTPIRDKELQNRVRPYDEINSTELERFLNFLEQSNTLNEGENPHFKIDKAGEILSRYNIKGENYVSTRTVNPNFHTNNADHGLTSSEWVDAMESINNPLAITSYRHLPNCYRVYTYAIKNGKSIYLPQFGIRNSKNSEQKSWQSYQIFVPL